MVPNGSDKILTCIICINTYYVTYNNTYNGPIIIHIINILPELLGSKLRRSCPFSSRYYSVYILTRKISPYISWYNYEIHLT